MYKLDYDLKHTWKNRSQIDNIDLSNRFCNFTKKYVTIDRKGRCFHCICDGWLPWPSGNLIDFQSIDDMFFNPISKKLQKTTETGGSFKFCSTASCGIRHKSMDSIDDFYYINFGIDDSCNLKCPSCREKLIFHKSGQIFEHKKTLANHFKNLIENTDKKLEIVVGSDGDAFASLIYRNFLYSLKENKSNRYVLKTNGLLIEKKIKTLPITNQIKRLEVSIDAGTRETYNIVRPPGDWNKLIDNLNFIKDNIDTKLRFNFAIQKNNFYDIEPFIELCSRYNAFPSMTMLEDWGTWSNFSEHSLSDPTNPYHDQWLEVRQNLIKRGILLGN